MTIKKKAPKPRCTIHLDKSTMATLDKLARITGFAKSIIIDHLLSRSLKAPSIKRALKTGKLRPGMLQRGPVYAHRRARALRGDARSRGETISNEEIFEVLKKARCLTKYGKPWDANKVSQQKLGLGKNLYIGKLE